MRLLLPLTGGLLLAMLLAWGIALNVLESAVEEQLDDRLRTATAALSDGSLPYSADLIDRLDRLIESRILFLDAGGRTRLASGDIDILPAIESYVGGLAWPENADEVVQTLDGSDSDWRVVIQRLPDGNDDRFSYVVAAASLEQTAHASRDAALLLAGAMLVATLALILLGSYFIRSITRPVTDLANMASSISAGRRDVTAPVNERNEIGLLATTLNDMAQKIDSYERDLSESSHRAGLGDLASRMAHEIRNPLTAIKMQLEMLEERLDGAEQERARNVLDEIRRLEIIVSSSLAIGGGQGVNPAPTNVASMMAAVEELLKPALSHRQIELDSRIDAMPEIAIDADRIKQVLLNLINNAADAIEHRGTIRLSTRKSDDAGITIDVEDSGPGVDDNAEDKPLGLGLGLKISREIVERHGGSLEAGRSESLGGAKFTIRLPDSIMAARETEA